MKSITVNEVLVLQKVIRERVNDLRKLRSEVSKRERYIYGKDENKVVEPQYDVKLVDRRITELERFIFETDTKLKLSNATTKVEIDFNMDKLLAPLE